MMSRLDRGLFMELYFLLREASSILIDQSAGKGSGWNAANKVAIITMKERPIKRKTLTTSTNGLKTTAIATNPAAQRYSPNKNAHRTTIVVARQIRKSTRGS